MSKKKPAPGPDDAEVTSKPPADSPLQRVANEARAAAGKKAKAKKAPRAPETVVVRESLRVDLTDDEVIERGRRAILVRGERDEVETELKSLQADYKARIKKLDAEFGSLVEAHNTRTEFRAVDCEQTFDYENERTWFVFRGKRYGERQMSDRERSEARLFDRAQPGDGPLGERLDPAKMPAPANGDTLAKQAAAAGA